MGLGVQEEEVMGLLEREEQALVLHQLLLELYLLHSNAKHNKENPHQMHTIPCVFSRDPPHLGLHFQQHC